MSEEISTLENVKDAFLCSSWAVAFADYGMSATEAQLLAMFRRRGYDPALSVGAFVDGQLISMTLNGIGMYNGVLTAYDTSTGTVKEYRRKGIASRLFNEALPLLREKNAHQYILEVLKGNEAAKNLYMKMGFTVVREFFFFRQPLAEVRAHLAALPLPAVASAASDNEIVELDALPDADILQALWDFSPSWQNSCASVQSKLTSTNSVHLCAMQALHRPTLHAHVHVAHQC